jgi:hypothetical protein
MSRRSRWQSVVSTSVAVVALACGPAAAADKTKVDQATQQVEQGARQIGDGQLGDGFKDLFVGIGLTIFEGAKFSALTVGEFFKKTFGA